jgi:hypothetical protein
LDAPLFEKACPLIFLGGIGFLACELEKIQRDFSLMLRPYLKT